MIRGATGEFFVTKHGGEEVRAFVPAPLPPALPLIFDGARQRLLERATLAVGRLDSITALLPNPDIFLYAYVRREAVLSSQIEGTQSSLSDLLLFELDEAPGVPFDDVVEVSNYVAALDHGMKRLETGFPLSNRLLREMHGKLLSSGRGREQTPGEFRITQNWIQGTRPGNAHFVPPPPHEVPNCMSALEAYLHSLTPPYPTLVTAALAHVQFETIHPFLDGNGRIGRLMIAFILHHGGILSRPLLYLSLFLKEHRTEYYRLLDLVRTEGDWEAWLDFYLEGVEITATNAVETAQRLVALFEADRKTVLELGRTGGSADRTHRVLRERPIVSLNDVATRGGMSFPTATKGMGQLVKLGIAEELTGRARNRVFAYRRYLAVLNEGVSPPG